MKIPVATYRLQFNRLFTFADAKELIEYLDQLGISDIYASPIFKARRESSHGYDIVRPNQINPELGSRTDFKDLERELKNHEMGWLQDIVPNHMAYSIENDMLRETLELGRYSRYFNFFDVDWNHHCKAIQGKILAPFLGGRYEECLAHHEIKLIYDGIFKIKYSNIELPVAIDSYRDILALGIPPLNERTQRDQALSRLRDIILRMEPCRWKDPSKEKHILQKALNDLCFKDNLVNSIINTCVERYNTDNRLLGELAANQLYRLSYWKAATDEINYRRFFDVSDLICLHSEELEVFNEIHRMILELTAKEEITGLRVDHIDGLKDPRQYLDRLRQRAPDSYIVVEKILMQGEKLRKSWPVQGTTGYDFLNSVNRLYLASSNVTTFDDLYRKFTRCRQSYGKIVQECKRLVIRTHFAGEVKNLVQIFRKILMKRSYGKQFSIKGLEEAISEMLVSVPVYRTYLSKENREDRAMQFLEYSIQDAKKRRSDLGHELNALEKLLREARLCDDALQCFMRLQQFTGSIMAKGFEDTTLYVFNRLISLNEVGNDPRIFGASPEEFHEFNRTRLLNWPHSMNATSTHDTKRGEDVRARLNILSEIPSEWKSALLTWSRLNRDIKEMSKGKPVPERNDEYYLYQTLVGTFPFDLKELPEYKERLKTHIEKAVREAKTNSSWIEPDLDYEKKLFSFIDSLLDLSKCNDFLQRFVTFQRRIARYGMFNSLSQTLLKITSPGVPDFYQGSELWDLNMVDPDNRRPVDFSKRTRLLMEILKMREGPNCTKSLLERYEDARVKLYEIHRSLNARRRRRELFEKGNYIPLQIKGPNKEHVVAYCRRKDEQWAVCVVPRLVATLVRKQRLPLNGDAWRDTVVVLPPGAPRLWKMVFTQRCLSAARMRSKDALILGELFEDFPVALLFEE